jgi:hypothetical protein
MRESRPPFIAAIVLTHLCMFVAGLVSGRSLDRPEKAVASAPPIEKRERPSGLLNVIVLGDRAEDARINVNGFEVGQGTRVQATIPAGSTMIDVEAEGAHCSPPRHLFVRPGDRVSLSVECESLGEWYGDEMDFSP